MSFSRLRTSLTFVSLNSIAGLQRSELINVVFDVTTLTASTILFSHTVFIYTTDVVILFGRQKKKAHRSLFFAWGSNADCIVTIVSTAQSVTKFNNVSRRRGTLYSNTLWAFLDTSLRDLFVFAREIITSCMGPKFSTETLWQTPHHHQTANTVNRHFRIYKWKKNAFENMSVWTCSSFPDHSVFALHGWFRQRKTLIDKMFSQRETHHLCFAFLKIVITRWLHKYQNTRLCMLSVSQFNTDQLSVRISLSSKFDNFY